MPPSRPLSRTGWRWLRSDTISYRRHRISREADRFVLPTAGCFAAHRPASPAARSRHLTAWNVLDWRGNDLLSTRRATSFEDFPTCTASSWTVARTCWRRQRNYMMSARVSSAQHSFASFPNGECHGCHRVLQETRVQISAVGKPAWLGLCRSINWWTGSKAITSTFFFFVFLWVLNVRYCRLPSW